MEYIRKQSLLADLNETTPHSYFAFETMVRAYPTEDVVPVVHAHWFKNDFGVPLCSACHKGWDSQPEKDGSPLFEYCPCCGAIMDEEVGK